MLSACTRAVGLSLVVCLVAALAAPALAAGPAHAGHAFPVSRGPGMTGLAGRGIGLITLLQAGALPVFGPLALLLPVGRALGRAVLPSPVHPTTAGRTMRGPAWPARRAALPFSTSAREALGTRELGSAQNLTSYLGVKGYDVSDLNAALSSAQTALGGSNLTAFREALTAYRTDLGAKISSGTLNRTVLQDYLKTLSVAHPWPAGGYIHNRMRWGSWRYRR